MGMPEVDYTWTLTSTGAGGAFDARGFAREYSFYVNTPAASSGSIQMQTAIDSTSAWISIGTVQTLQASAGTLLQFTGPFALLRPYSSNVSGTMVVRLIGN